MIETKKAKNSDKTETDIVESATDVTLLEEKALNNYKFSRFKDAYNDFVKILEIDPQNEKAKYYMSIIKGVMNYEYRENINV